MDNVILYREWCYASSEEITDDPNQVEKLFSVGSSVNTEEGPGVVVDVQFNVAEYEGAIQLEPPAIVVELEDGSTIHTCLCSIELPDDEGGTDILHSEFDRLWPPMDEHIPDDAEMLLPEEEEAEEATMRTARTRRRRATLNTPVRIYIADLEAYNAGKLRGEWIDLPADPDELKEVVKRMSRDMQQDWAIHDYEAPFRIEEYEDVFALNTAMQKIADSHLDLDIIACIKDYGYDNWDDALEAAEDAMVVEAKNDEDLAYSFVEDMGGVSELGQENVEMYFDYESFGRDASMDIAEDVDQEYYDQFSNDREYGEALIDDFGGVSVLGDTAERYFDYEKFGRDLAMDYFQCGSYYIRID